MGMRNKKNKTRGLGASQVDTSSAALYGWILLFFKWMCI